VVAGKVQVTRVEHRCGTGQALQNRRFEIVDHDLGRHAAEAREGMFVTGEEMLHGLRDSELHEHLAAERQHHDEEGKPATGIAHGDGAVGTPVDLRALAGSEVQLQIDRSLGRPDAADVIPQDRHAAMVSLLAQTLEDLLSAVWVGVQQPRDARLEGIQQTAARPAAPRLEARTGDPRGDRPCVKAQCPGGLRDRQALAIMAVVDLGERLVIDHHRLRHQARDCAARSADVASMSCTSSSKRTVVRTMSSCNGVPTIWAIKPIKTAGCSVKTSCNGEPAGGAAPITESTGCAIERSCNAAPTRRALRQYPGWRDRHAWTRATFTGPRK
jgi:hypothetical protein